MPSKVITLPGWFKWLEPADTYKMPNANMKNITNAAFVVSVHYDDPYGAAHLNLKWKGNHRISDVDLGRLGEVLHCETETENTGWVIVRSSYVLKTLIVAPLSQSGPPVLQSSSLVSPGDEVPLLSDGERLNGFIRLKDRLKRVRDACNKIAFLPMTDRGHSAVNPSGSSVGQGTDLIPNHQREKSGARFADNLFSRLTVKIGFSKDRSLLKRN
jgi:hypothetical protein